MNPADPIVPGKKEARLEQLREEAARTGQVAGQGIRAAGGPMPISPPHASPHASQQTGYYQQPMLKAPQWTWAIPLYFFVGGASGSLGVIGSLADVLGDEYALAKKARWLATGGAALSSGLLVYDLGRPARFLNMLRVFKPQSAMSVGSWVLSAFSTAAAAASFADLLRARYGDTLPIQLISGAGRVGSTLFGMPFHNYTGVLLGASVIPVWNARSHSLPKEFGMSGLQSAVSILELMGHDDSRALNLLGLLSSGLESKEMLATALHASQTTERERRILAPTHHGLSGALLQAGALLGGPIPLLLRTASLFSGRQSGGKPSRMRQLAACSAIAGSLCLRYGWLEAGIASSRDWRLPLERD